MKIVITGAEGFIGKHLSKSLVLEHEVISVDIKQGVDLTKTESLKKFFDFDFDVLIHLAGKSFVPYSFSNPSDVLSNNFQTTLNSLEVCRQHAAKYIFLSSYLYGKPDYLPTDEGHELRPTNPYAQSKIIGEELCKGYARDFGLRTVIVRPFNLIGPGQLSQFLLPTILHQALDQKTIILNDLTPKRDYLDVRDFCQLLNRLIIDDSITNEIFNAGSGTSYSPKEIVRELSKILNREFELIGKSDTRQNEILETRADIQKAKAILNWNPIFSLRETLEYILQSEGLNV